MLSAELHIAPELCPNGKFLFGRDGETPVKYKHQGEPDMLVAQLLEDLLQHCLEDTMVILRNEKKEIVGKMFTDQAITGWTDDQRRFVTMRVYQLGLTSNSSHYWNVTVVGAEPIQIEME